MKRDEVKTHPPRYATLRFVINVSSCEDFTLSMTMLEESDEEEEEEEEEEI